jgi:glutathione S-transferase
MHRSVPGTNLCMGRFNDDREGDVLLYDMASSGNCYKVRLVLPYRGLSYRREPVGLKRETNREGILGGLNPALRVPTLVLDDGRVLAESNAIIWFLAEGTPLVPDDAFERAQVLQWMFFEQYDHEPAIAVARAWLLFSDDPAQFAARLPERIEAGHRALDAMQRHLVGRRYLVGEQLTVADVALYASTHVADEAGVELDAFPAVRAWLDRVAAQPGHVTNDD